MSVTELFLGSDEGRSGLVIRTRPRAVWVAMRPSPAPDSSRVPGPSCQQSPPSGRHIYPSPCLPVVITPWIVSLVVLFVCGLLSRRMSSESRPLAETAFASSSSPSHTPPAPQPSQPPPMPPISQPGLRARAAYRAYLPPRPSLSGFRRSFRTTTANGKEQTGPDGEPVMGSQKKKRRGMGCESLSRSCIISHVWAQAK